MPTADLTITATPAKIVDAGDEFFLTLDTIPAVRIATVDSGDPAPTVRGHRLNPAMGESINRALIGPGDVWAWSDGVTSVTASVTAWTP